VGLTLQEQDEERTIKMTYLHSGTWEDEAISLRAALTYIEKALRERGTDAALVTIQRARTTSDAHREARQQQIATAR
jgi:hypothetical protein